MGSAAVEAQCTKGSAPHLNRYVEITEFRGGVFDSVPDCEPKKYVSLLFCVNSILGRCGSRFACPILSMAELRHSDEKAGTFIVGDRFPRSELNGVYRYFLHQNPEIRVKNIAAAAPGGPG